MEAEVTVNDKGKFEVEIQKVGKNKRIGGTIGSFDNYEEAKAELYEKFFEFFDRPSENAIKFGGRNPKERVWKNTAKGKQVTNSVSMIEGSEARAILGSEVIEKELSPNRQQLKSYKMKVPKISAPSIITVRTLYPSYFKHVRELHVKKIARLKKMRGKR